MIRILWCTIFLLAWACSSPEPAGQTEPVAPAEEKTPYPEDPDLAKSDTDPKPGAGSESDTSADVPSSELTDQESSAPSSADSSTDASSPSKESGDENLPTPDAGDAVGNAFDDAQTPPTADDLLAGPKDLPATGKHKPSKPKGGKTTRYVAAILLNVRGQPSFKSPIVRRLLGGAKIHIDVTKGAWTKIAKGQWVRSKFLSTAPTRRVTQEEAERAWKRKHRPSPNR